MTVFARAVRSVFGGTGRDRKAEADVGADPQQVTNRQPDGAYVGRVAADVTGDAGETGAERRADWQARVEARQAP